MNANNALIEVCVIGGIWGIINPRYGFGVLFVYGLCYWGGILS